MYFEQVLKIELKGMKKAFGSFGPEYNPEVTVVVVLKRHRTRFFPQQSGAAGINGNVLPGTVVDKDITHPTEFDFYLVSHVSRKVRLYG